MRTSTEWAPWYLVPGDRKWVRDLAVSSELDRRAGRDLRLQWPAVDPPCASCESPETTWRPPTREQAIGMSLDHLLKQAEHLGEEAAAKAKDVVEDRGGTEALKTDAARRSRRR